MKSSPPNRTQIEAAIGRLLEAAGLDPAHADLVDTPRRVAELWQTQLLNGYGLDPREILADPVVGESNPDIVFITGISFHAMCPHHLLPFQGKAHVAYRAEGKLVGFGRIADLVACFTQRLTLQERATCQIAEALAEHLPASGAGCVLEARQLCLGVPDDRHDGNHVVTSAFVGELRDRPDVRDRLLGCAFVKGSAG